MMEVHPSESRLLLALDRELDAADLATIDAHVRTCADCRATWDELARLSEEIADYCRTLPARSPLPLPSPSPVPVVDRRVWWWPAFSWAGAGRAVLVAAAVVLLVGVGWLVNARMTAAPSGSSQGRTDPGMQASRHRQDMPLVSLPAAARDDAAHVAKAGNPGVPAMAVPLGGPPEGHRRRPRPSASSHSQTVARAAQRPKPTYYWELPYSNGALPLSEGSVVMTVRLSRDQLRLAGIPVSTLQPVTDKPWVRAKVLVGADGLPRAIAFDQD